jgi:hypothetical protein
VVKNKPELTFRIIEFKSTLTEKPQNAGKQPFKEEKRSGVLEVFRFSVKLIQIV